MSTRWLARRVNPPPARSVNSSTAMQTPTTGAAKKAASVPSSGGVPPFLRGHAARAASQEAPVGLAVAAAARAANPQSRGLNVDVLPDVDAAEAELVARMEMARSPLPFRKIGVIGSGVMANVIVCT